MWMKTRLYSADRIPFISDTSAYGRAWTTWWMACQPSWRQNKGWPPPRDEGKDPKWGKLTARGQNGMFIVVMSTTWWAASLKPSDDRAAFDEAVEDIRWVIERVTEFLLLPGPGTTQVTRDPSPAQDPHNPPTATWQAREEGKRRSKPSRKLMESLN